MPAQGRARCTFLEAEVSGSGGRPALPGERAGSVMKASLFCTNLRTHKIPEVTRKHRKNRKKSFKEGNPQGRSFIYGRSTPCASPESSSTAWDQSPGEDECSGQGTARALGTAQPAPRSTPGQGKGSLLDKPSWRWKGAPGELCPGAGVQLQSLQTWERLCQHRGTPAQGLKPPVCSQWAQEQPDPSPQTSSHREPCSACRSWGRSQPKLSPRVATCPEQAAAKS